MRKSAVAAREKKPNAMRRDRNVRIRYPLVLWNEERIPVTLDCARLRGARLGMSRAGFVGPASGCWASLLASGFGLPAPASRFGLSDRLGLRDFFFGLPPPPSTLQILQNRDLPILFIVL